MDGRPSADDAPNLWITHRLGEQLRPAFRLLLHFT